MTTLSVKIMFIYRLLFILFLFVIAAGVFGQSPTLTDVRIRLFSETDSSVFDYGQPINAVMPGEEFHYTVQLVNLGENSAEAIVVTQILPPEVSYIQSTLLPTVSGNQLVWELTDLGVAASMTWDVDVRLTPDVPEGVDELISVASFTCSNDRADINNSSSETIRIIRPRLQFVDVGVQIVVQADTFVERSGAIYPAVTNNHLHFYNINVHNNSPMAAESVRVTYTNTMPGALTSVSQDPPADGVTGDSLYWIIPVPAGRTTIRVHASGALQEEGAILSSVRVAAVNDTSAANDTDSVAVWFLAEKEMPSANYDLEIDYNALADSTIQIAGNNYKATRFDDEFGYFMWIRNNGPATAHAIEVQNSLPNELTLSQFSHAPHRATENTCIWQIDSLLAGAAWTLYYKAVMKEGAGDFPLRLTASAVVSAVGDTLADNNSQEAVVYILGDPLVFADLAVHQSTAADSFETTDSGPLPLMLQGAASEVTLLVSNNSTTAADNVCITYVVDDSFAIIGARPSPDFYAADSVAWLLSAIESGQTREFFVEISLAEIMPVQRNLLHNILSVIADNEDPAALDDNRVMLTMVNYGIVVEPFTPLIEVTPAMATVSDSLWIRVQFPVEIVEWDLRVHLPNGDIRTDYADAFIARTAIEPGVWYDIDEPFLHRTLLDGGSADEIAFEVQALGRFGSRGSARSQVVVNLEFALLPPNVVSPAHDVIAIDFVVPTGHVEMQLYDVAGRHIATLADEYYQAGRHTLMWNGMENGQLVGSGVYLITLRTRDANTWKKIIIVR